MIPADVRERDRGQRRGRRRPRPGRHDARLEQLRQLGELKTQGVLTDAEFEAQTSRILGG
jgi:Short C-terminal domain